MSEAANLVAPREPEREFIEAQRVARLATADAGGQPHVVPVCFVLRGMSVYVTVDEKPKRSSRRPLKRVRNILENPAAALIVDHYEEDWQQLGWVMLRGPAEILTAGGEHQAVQVALAERYPQYRNMDLTPLPVIALRITQINSWGELRR